MLVKCISVSIKLSAVLFFLCAVCSAAEIKGNKSMNTHLSPENYVSDIVKHPAFKGFGEMLLTRDNNSGNYDVKLSDIARLMPYHGNVDADAVLAAVNRMIDYVNAGKTIFYDIYDQKAKNEDPSKKHTGLFFFRGEKNKPFAVISPGGGFSYAGSLHEGFPLAHEISKKGFNAFVIRYRLGSQQRATEDLAAAISFIFKNAQDLGVSTKDYSLWGGSAGARMVGNIAMNGVAAYGESGIAEPETAVIAYTGQSGYCGNFPRTFITVSADDRITDARTVENRVKNLKRSGVEVEYREYKKAGHGFGLGTGTDAQGWLDHAVNFWQKK